MGLQGTDVHGFSGETPVVNRGSLRSGRLQTDFVFSGYALLCTDVRPKVGIHHQRRMATTRTVGRTSKARMQRDCFSYIRSRPTKLSLLLLSVLPDASDRDLLIWMWRKHLVFISNDKKLLRLLSLYKVPGSL